MSTEHNPCLLLGILLNLVVVTGTSLVIVCSLANQYDFPEPVPKLLRQDLQTTAESKSSPISPAPWLHCAWAVVFFWQLVMALHALACICRTWAGVPVYTCPVLISPPLLLCLDLAYGLNVAWFVVYDREYPSTACLFIVLSMALAWAAYALSLYNLEVNLFRLRKAERYAEICAHRFVVQNGLALYAMWCMFVASFNVAVAMMHNDRKSLNENLSALVALGVMGAFMVGFFLSDVTCLDKYTRHTGTPYILSILVLSASFFRQDDWRSDDPVFIVLAAILTLSFLLCMAKSAIVLCRVMRPSTFGSIDVTTGSFGRSSPEDEAKYLLK